MIATNQKVAVAHESFIGVGREEGILWDSPNGNTVQVEVLAEPLSVQSLPLKTWGQAKVKIKKSEAEGVEPRPEQDTCHVSHVGMVIAFTGFMTAEIIVCISTMRQRRTDRQP